MQGSGCESFSWLPFPCGVGAPQGHGGLRPCPRVQRHSCLPRSVRRGAVGSSRGGGLFLFSVEFIKHEFYSVILKLSWCPALVRRQPREIEWSATR